MAGAGGPRLEIDCPYPGIRPFRRAEQRYFFGRQAQVDEIVRRLSEHHFSAVIGGSGCGKSSLVRAGVIPELERMAIPDRGDFWRVAIMTPSDAPLESLVEALDGVLEPESAADRAAGRPTGRKASIEANLLENLSLAAFLDEFRQRIALEDGLPTELRQHVNLLLLVDQFEEIFRDSNAGSLAARQFVRLIVDAERRKAPGIYVALTMRSEDIHRCAAFLDLPDVLNKAAYFARRLDEDELALAIIRPAQLACWKAGLLPWPTDETIGDTRPYALAVVRDLLDAVAAMSDDPDHLPLLQHTLLMLWLQATRRWAEESIARSSGVGVEITEDDLARALGLAAADPGGGRRLDQRSAPGWLIRWALEHAADRSFKALDPDQQRIAEELFRRLAHLDSQGQYKREFTDVATVAASTGAALRPAEAVVGAFSAPYPFIRRTATGRIDVAHEAFIRNWPRCRQWLEDERQMVAGVGSVYRALVNRRRAIGEASGSLPRRLMLRLTERLSKERLRASARWAEARAGNAPWLARYLPELQQKFGALHAASDPRHVDHELVRFRRLSLWGNRWPASLLLVLVVLVPLTWGLWQQNRATTAMAEAETTRAAAAAARADEQEARRRLTDFQNELLKLNLETTEFQPGYKPPPGRREALLVPLDWIATLERLRPMLQELRPEPATDTADEAAEIAFQDSARLLRSLEFITHGKARQLLDQNAWRRSGSRAGPLPGFALISPALLPSCARPVPEHRIVNAFTIGDGIGFIGRNGRLVTVGFTRDGSCHGEPQVMLELAENEKVAPVLDPTLIRIVRAPSEWTPTPQSVPHPVYERLHRLLWYRSCVPPSEKGCEAMAWWAVPSSDVVHLTNTSGEALGASQTLIHDHMVVPATEDPPDDLVFETVSAAAEPLGAPVSVARAKSAGVDGVYVAELVKVPGGALETHELVVSREAPSVTVEAARQPIFRQTIIGYRLDGLAIEVPADGPGWLYLRTADGAYLRTYWRLQELKSILCGLAHSLELEDHEMPQSWLDRRAEYCDREDAS